MRRPTLRREKAAASHRAARPDRHMTSRSGRIDSMEVLVTPAAEKDKPIVRRLLELNAHDFSEIDGRDLGPHGEYGYRYFDHYWLDNENRHPYLITVDGNIGECSARSTPVTHMSSESSSSSASTGAAVSAPPLPERSSSGSLATGWSTRSRATTQQRPSGAVPSRVTLRRPKTPPGSPSTSAPVVSADVRSGRCQQRRAWCPTLNAVGRRHGSRQLAPMSLGPRRTASRVVVSVGVQVR